MKEGQVAFDPNREKTGLCLNYDNQVNRCCVGPGGICPYLRLLYKELIRGRKSEVKVSRCWCVSTGLDLSEHDTGLVDPNFVIVYERAKKRRLKTD